MPNFKITIEYDGSVYHGWQRQAVDRTIQGEIENALMTMTVDIVTVTGSGRTDAGVHALMRHIADSRGFSKRTQQPFAERYCHNFVQSGSGKVPCPI